MVLNFYISFSISYQQSNSTSFKWLQLANDQKVVINICPLQMEEGSQAQLILNCNHQSCCLLTFQLKTRVAGEASPKRGFSWVRLGMVLCWHKFNPAESRNRRLRLCLHLHFPESPQRLARNRNQVCGVAMMFLFSVCIFEMNTC